MYRIMGISMYSDFSYLIRRRENSKEVRDMKRIGPLSAKIQRTAHTIKVE
jgi:hypothetical protein